MISNTDDVAYFKGNVFTSAIGIAIVTLLTVMPVLLYVLGDIIPVFLMSLIFLPLMMIQFRSYNYFGVSTYYILVRNHGWIWRRKKFYFDEIKEILFDKIGSDNCLVVTLNSNKKYTYRAETLKDIHWLGLMKALTELRVSVTDKEKLAVLVTPGMKKVNRIMSLLAFVCILFMVYLGSYISDLPVGSTHRIIAAVVFILLIFLLLIGMFIVYLWLCNKYDDDTTTDDSAD